MLCKFCGQVFRNLPVITYLWHSGSLISNTVVRGMAGHSKWSNIRHTKAAKDGAKARQTAQVLRKLRLAAYSGGSNDPKLNVKLDQVIKLAKSCNIPSKTLQTALQGLEKTTSTGETYILEARGIGGYSLLIEVITDNLKRTRQNLMYALKKTGAAWSEGGGGKYLFDHKGVINIAPTENQTFEKAEEDAIEIGAEEVKIQEDEEGVKFLQFLCHPDDFLNIENQLDQLSYKITSAKLDYIPNTKVSLNDKELQNAGTLLDMLEENPDVVHVYDNIE